MPSRKLPGGNKKNHRKLNEVSRGSIEIRIENIPNTEYPRSLLLGQPFRNSADVRSISASGTNLMCIAY
jgi:hypothetical protein